MSRGVKDVIVLHPLNKYFTYEVKSRDVKDVIVLHPLNTYFIQ
jgi:hypothetical protein